MLSEGFGTQTAVINTEHTLATVTNTRTYVLTVDCVNMAAGDTLELRAKVKALTGGTARVAYYDVFSGDQGVDDEIKISVPVPSLYSCAFTLKQTAGTGRNFDWNVLSL